MKRYLPRIAFWLALWLPWLYVGVFADTRYQIFLPIEFHSRPSSENREYGWPYPCLELHWNLQSFANDLSATVEFFYPSLLAVNFLVSVAIATVFAFAIGKCTGAIRRNGFRFRTSTLLLLVVVVSLPLAGWRYVSDAREREIELMDELEPLGGVTTFEEYQGPLLLLRLERFLPESLLEMWWRCDCVELSHSAFAEGRAELVRDLKRFAYLQELRIHSIQEDSPAILRELPNIARVDLTYVPINEVSLNHLQSCPHLRFIDLTDCEVSTKAMEQLRKALPDTEIMYDGEETAE